MLLVMFIALIVFAVVATAGVGIWFVYVLRSDKRGEANTGDDRLNR